MTENSCKQWQSERVAFCCSCELCESCEAVAAHGKRLVRFLGSVASVLDGATWKPERELRSEALDLSGAIAKRAAGEPVP